jgi:hypothetical protein
LQDLPNIEHSIESHRHDDERMNARCYVLAVLDLLLSFFVALPCLIETHEETLEQQVDERPEAQAKDGQYSELFLGRLRRDLWE